MSEASMRAALRVISQIGNGAIDELAEIPADVATVARPWASSIVARLAAVAHLALIKEPEALVVDLRPTDLAILRNALRCYRLELEDSPMRDEVEIAEVRRIVERIDVAQAAVARGAPEPGVAEALALAGEVVADAAAARDLEPIKPPVPEIVPEDDFG